MANSSVEFARTNPIPKRDGCHNQTDPLPKGPSWIRLKNGLEIKRLVNECLGLPATGHLGSQLRRHEMKDHGSRDACRNGNDCAPAPIRKNAKCKYHQACQQSDFNQSQGRFLPWTFGPGLARERS